MRVPAWLYTSRVMSTLHIIYASTSGNTEHVVHTLVQALRMTRPDLEIDSQRVELARPEDLLRGDVVLLGSGTWNTGGNEGQLNTHMHAFLRERARDVDLGGKPMAFISLGDDRYYHRTRCTEHFLRFQREHHGTLLLSPLIIVNEPYGQEDKILRWAQKLVDRLGQSMPF